MSNAVKYVKSKLRDVFVNKPNIAKLGNVKSMLCNNCVGGAVLHDFHL